MKIPGAIPPVWPALLLAVAGLLLAGGTPALAQRNAKEPRPTPMKRPPPDTNSVPWHTIIVTPKPGLPEIHFYNKLNPVWWLQNADEPEPPDWYLPDDQCRVMKWRFRNPFHNFNHYVIGVADKNFYRSGRYPERNSDPNGGWNFAVARRKLALLPFVSYERRWITFYFGWREHGAFGIEMRFHCKKPVDSSGPEAASPDGGSDQNGLPNQRKTDEPDEPNKR